MGRGEVEVKVKGKLIAAFTTKDISKENLIDRYPHRGQLVEIELPRGMKAIRTCHKCRHFEEDFQYGDKCHHLETISDAPHSVNWQGCGYWKPIKSDKERKCDLPVNEALAKIAAIADESARLPTNWLDPLLSGPNAVIGNQPYDCKDIERLLCALNKRMGVE
jgi:hypothetical protein